MQLQLVDPSYAHICYVLSLAIVKLFKEAALPPKETLVVIFEYKILDNLIKIFIPFMQSSILTKYKSLLALSSR